MIYFLEGFAKIQKYQICLLFQSKLPSKVFYKLNKLGLAWAFFTKPMLKFIKSIILVKVFGDVRSNYMLHHFTQNTC